MSENNDDPKSKGTSGTDRGAEWFGLYRVGFNQKRPRDAWIARDEDQWITDGSIILCGRGPGPDR